MAITVTIGEANTGNFANKCEPNIPLKLVRIQANHACDESNARAISARKLFTDKIDKTVFISILNEYGVPYIFDVAEGKLVTDWMRDYLMFVPWTGTCVVFKELK